MGGAAKQFEPGETIAGKFRIEQRLGEGGMGIVLLATHLEIGQKVAIKFLFPEYANVADSALRFVREARAAAALTSDHAVRVHDVGRLDTGAPYMVMEYLEGRDLGQVVQQDGPLAIGRCVDYVLQAIDAIAEAHAAGIVHRDLKPSNLFLARRGRAQRIKVLDFGISKIASDSKANLELTKTAAVLGSPFYMAPEQMRSTRSVDHRADIWSLGVILYELSTGAMPFQAETLTELCLMIAQDEPQSIRAIRADVPPELEQIVTRCLQKNPADRYATVTELADDLERWRGSDPAIAAPSSRLTPSERSVVPAVPPSVPNAPNAPDVTGPRPNPQPAPASFAKSAEVTWGKTRAPAGGASSRWRAFGVVMGIGILAAAVAAFVSIRNAPTRSPASALPSATAVAVDPTPTTTEAAPRPLPSEPPAVSSSATPPSKPRPAAPRPPLSTPPPVKTAPPPPPKPSASSSTFSHDRQ